MANVGRLCRRKRLGPVRLGSLVRLDCARILLNRVELIAVLYRPIALGKRTPLAAALQARLGSRRCFFARRIDDDGVFGGRRRVRNCVFIIGNSIMVRQEVEGNSLASFHSSLDLASLSRRRRHHARDSLQLSHSRLDASAKLALVVGIVVGIHWVDNVVVTGCGQLELFRQLRRRAEVLKTRKQRTD